MTERLHFHFSLSHIGEENGNPLQCSCLENPRDRGAWWAAVYGVTQSRTRLKRLSSSSSNTVHCRELSSVQSLSCLRLFVTPWTVACQASQSITNSRSPPKPMSIDLVMMSNHLILCYPLLFLLSIFPSIRVFSSESVLHIRGSKCWSFSFNISPSSECSGLISFRIDWFDLLAVQGTLKTSAAPQFKSINSSVLSFLYGPTLTFTHDYWKNHSFDKTDLCRQSNVSAF